MSEMKTRQIIINFKALAGGSTDDLNYARDRVNYQQYSYSDDTYTVKRIITKRKFKVSSYMANLN